MRKYLISCLFLATAASAGTAEYGIELRPFGHPVKRMRRCLSGEATKPMPTL